MSNFDQHARAGGVVRPSRAGIEESYKAADVCLFRPGAKETEYFDRLLERLPQRA